MSRFKGKPVQGLPGRLPPGEDIIWQAKPQWRSLARHAFHLKAVAVYFSLLVFWRIAGSVASGHTLRYALTSAISCLTLAFAATALFSVFAWAIARTTTYTITDRRVVITYGMALPKSLNLPFGSIEAADLKILADGNGDIAIRLPAAKRLSYMLLWPHARSGANSRTEPVIRCIAAPQDVAALLAEALAASLPDPASFATAKPANTRPTSQVATSPALHTGAQPA